MNQPSMRVKISFKNQSVCGLMEKIVSLYAVYTVPTKRVTESMAAVFIVVKMGTNVLMVYFPISINFQ